MSPTKQEELFDEALQIKWDESNDSLLSVVINLALLYELIGGMGGGGPFI